MTRCGPPYVGWFWYWATFPSRPWKEKQMHKVQTIFRKSEGLDRWCPFECDGRHTLLIDTSLSQGIFTRTKMITMDSHSSHSPKYCGSQSGKLQHSMQVTGTAADNFLEMSSVCSFCVLTVVTMGTKTFFHIPSQWGANVCHTYAENTSLQYVRCWLASFKAILHRPSLLGLCFQHLWNSSDFY